MARRDITALLLATLLSAGGCYDSHFSEAAGGAAAGEGNTPLSELRARYTGRPTLVEEDIRVVGYVTTSDRAGNFYRTLCIEQAGAALEVMVGLDHLHNDYPPGSRLMVRLRGLALGLQTGLHQAGIVLGHREEERGSCSGEMVLFHPTEQVGATHRRHDDAVLDSERT